MFTVLNNGSPWRIPSWVKEAFLSTKKVGSKVPRIRSQAEEMKPTSTRATCIPVTEVHVPCAWTIMDDYRSRLARFLSNENLFPCLGLLREPIDEALLSLSWFSTAVRINFTLPLILVHFLVCYLRMGHPTQSKEWLSNPIFAHHVWENLWITELIWKLLHKAQIRGLHSTIWGLSKSVICT